MPTFKTAEEILGGIRECLQERAEHAPLFSEIHNLLPEKHRIRLMGPMDEAEELARAVAALDVALEHLTKPLEPVRDERRHHQPPRKAD